MNGRLDHRTHSGDPVGVVCAVSHLNEFSLELTLQSLQRQSSIPEDQIVITGVTPMSASFNAALDWAWEQKADVLVHTAADVILMPDAIKVLLATLDIRHNYLAVGRGYDILNGPQARVGLWAFNMQVIKNKYRFRDMFKQDLDFCKRVEDKTGLSRVYSPRRTPLAYHDPIWVPERAYMRLLYSTPKYGADKAIAYQNFLIHELGWNPGNQVLIAGLRALHRAIREGSHKLASKNPGQLQAAFEADSANLRLTGKEYFALHRRWKHAAKRLLQSEYECVCLEDRRGASLRRRIRALGGRRKWKDHLVSE